MFDRIVEFVAGTLAKPDADPGIANAVAISFLEYRTLFESRKGREAIDHLPLSIKKILEQYDF